MSDAADSGHRNRATTSHPSASRRLAHVVSIASSTVALAVVCYGLLQLDLPIVRYLRTFTSHRAGEQLMVPWMAWTSDAGDWIGEGFHLLAISVVLLAIGWSLSKPHFKRAGIETLWAHGMAALLSNGLKHLLGRPRPKFVHSGEWQFSPTWASGLDSFPSGHTTASFAVAAVLAKRFPTFGPLCFGIAAFVALSRVIRGSHFPTDVFGGAVLGILSGSLAAAPWKQWGASLAEGLRHAAMGTAGVLAVLWSLARPAEGGMIGQVWMLLAVAAIASGFWLRRMQWIRPGRPVIAHHENASSLLIAYGLACLTTAPLVIAAVGLACLAYWMDQPSEADNFEAKSRTRTWVTESALVAGVLVALTILYEGRGALPF